MIRVVSLAINVPGPVAAARLRGLGATVLKVEPPEGDPLRRASPTWYQALHDDIEVCTLDLKTKTGQERLGSLLSHSDLLLTSMRTAALERLDLSWPILSARYPRLCQVAIVGYPAGQANQAGHDLTYQASLGLLQPGDDPSKPSLPRTLLADLAGAERAVTVTLALLLARERGQGSSYAEVALIDAAADFAVPLHVGLTAPNGLLGGGFPGYNLYQTSTGWISLAALEPHFWRKLLAEFNLPAGATPEENKAELARIFLTQPAEVWERWAAVRDLPLRVVV